MSKYYYFGELQRVIEEENLTQLELKIYCKIANLPQGLTCSYEKLSEMVWCSLSSAKRSIKTLKDKKLIEGNIGTIKLSRFKSVKNDTESVKNDLNECQKRHSQSVKNEPSPTSIGITNFRNTKRAKAFNFDSIEKSIPKAFDDQVGRMALEEFIDYRRDIKKPIKTEATIKAIFKKFNGYTSEDLNDSVQNTIANGWQGLFLPKGNRTSKVKPLTINEGDELITADFLKGAA